MTPLELSQHYRKLILEKIPEGKVVTRHGDKGHFYEIVGVSKPDKPYPSVTSKLQILKDPSLANWKMNMAIRYISEHYKEFNNANVAGHLRAAAESSTLVFHDAGHIGTAIHDMREDYFNEWIRQGERPSRAVNSIPKDFEDVRAMSAMSALDTFCDEWGYIPVVSELFVWDAELELAGTLDDIGIMRNILNPRPENMKCKHHFTVYSRGVGIEWCMDCGQKYQGYKLVLLDLKTSNQFKNTYFFQVSMYWMMFHKITGIKPDRNLILKLDKKDRSYKIEDLKYMNRLVSYSKYMLKTNEAIEFIDSLRKDNQKVLL